VDNTWQPLHPDTFPKFNVIVRNSLQFMKGPLYFISSIGHMIAYHFQILEFTPEQQPYVRQSLYAVVMFSFTFFPLLYWYAGMWGVFSYYVVPWFVFHFWLSTFTLIQHTLPHIPFKNEKEWDLVSSRFTSSVHCSYPFWVEFLNHDINIHIPHHLTTAIPCYNLRWAHKILKQNWSEHMHEVVFGWELISDVVSRCHMYHEKKYYQTFTEFWKNADL